MILAAAGATARRNRTRLTVRLRHFGKAAKPPRSEPKASEVRAPAKTRGEAAAQRAEGERSAGPCEDARRSRRAASPSSERARRACEEMPPHASRHRDPLAGVARVGPRGARRG